MYLILRHWLAPGVAVAGAAMWTFSPLVLHLGQVPMPDICVPRHVRRLLVCVEKQFPCLQRLFLFAVLAKVGVAVFGLPF